MMALGEFDFEAQIVGTVSAARKVSLPLRVSLSELPQEAVIYAGGNAALDLALKLPGVSLPVTIASLRSDLGAQSATYGVGGVNFSGGSSSEFQSLVSMAEGTETAQVEIRFAPSEIGYRVETAAPQLLGAQIEGTGGWTDLLNLLLPFFLDFVSLAILRQTVSGTGIPPIIVEPNPLDFGSQPVGTSGPPLGITITNKTAGEVKIRELSESGTALHTDMQCFDLVSDGCTGQLLVPGGQCQVVWRFRPDNTKDYRISEIPIGDFADTPAAHITLSGEGEAAALSAVPVSLDFGSRPITTAGGDLMTFLATTKALFVSALRFDGPDAASFVIVDETCIGRTLQPGADAAVAVDFAPEHIGHAAATLLIIASDQRTLLEIPLRGIGTAAADLKVCVATSATAESMVYSVTVTNDGPSTAVATNVWLQLPPAARFASSDHPLTSPRENTEGILSWRVGTLLRGESLTVTASASLPPDGFPAPAKAWASSATFDPDPATNSINLFRSVS